MQPLSTEPSKRYAGDGRTYGPHVSVSEDRSAAMASSPPPRQRYSDNFTRNWNIFACLTFVAFGVMAALQMSDRCHNNGGDQPRLTKWLALTLVGLVVGLMTWVINRYVPSIMKTHAVGAGFFVLLYIPAMIIGIMLYSYTIPLVVSTEADRLTRWTEGILIFVMLILVNAAASIALVILAMIAQATYYLGRKHQYTRVSTADGDSRGVHSATSSRLSDSYYGHVSENRLIVAFIACLIVMFFGFYASLEVPVCEDSVKLIACETAVSVNCTTAEPMTYPTSGYVGLRCSYMDVAKCNFTTNWEQTGRISWNYKAYEWYSPIDLGGSALLLLATFQANAPMRASAILMVIYGTIAVALYYQHTLQIYYDMAVFLTVGSGAIAMFTIATDFRWRLLRGTRDDISFTGAAMEAFETARSAYGDSAKIEGRPYVTPL